MRILYATDFEYDGRLLSDFGFIICRFGDSGGEETVNAGGEISFNTTSTNRGRKFQLTSATYKDCISTSFSICKNECNEEDMVISDEEFRDIMRWLSRHTFHKLRFIKDEEYEPCYYEASFNIHKITINDVLYGIECNMETNRPFGFGAEVHKIYELNGKSDVAVLTDMSDEIGYIYPKVVITCKNDSKEEGIRIHNKTTGGTMVFRGYKKGEIITVNGATRTIDVSGENSSHDIYDDFNYEFLKIGNTIDNRVNEITASQPCRLEIIYNPIIRSTP